MLLSGKFVVFPFIYEQDCSSFVLILLISYYDTQNSNIISNVLCIVTQRSNLLFKHTIAVYNVRLCIQTYFSSKNKKRNGFLRAMGLRIFFYIRTSNFQLRLSVLIFNQVLRLSLFLPCSCVDQIKSNQIFYVKYKRYTQ